MFACYNYNGDYMRDLLKLLFMFSLVAIVYIYRNNISNFISNKIIYHGSNTVLTYNEYYLDNDYLFVQNTDSYDVKNYQELLNMFYTIINSGDNSYSFKCNYSSCLDDIQKLIDDETTISEINNFVHPFNSFSTINIDITTGGIITIKPKKAYTDEQILFVNTYIEQYIKDNIKDNMSSYDKIKSFHDFIINNTVYDKNITKSSYTAYDLITTGKSICGGYSDIMSIYLYKIGILNYRIASKNHIWNLIKLDDKWYHIDSTWDDPIASDGNQYLLHNFFMLSTDELLKLDDIEHNFDKNIYLEAK